jgi:hypothetical protein
LGSGLDAELESDWGGVTPVCARDREVEEESGRVRSNAGLSVCGPSGVGGTTATVGGCGAGVTVAGAGIVTAGIGGLKNVKGRALIGGSSRLDGESGA